MSFESFVKGTQNTADNLIGVTDTTPILKLGKENVVIREGPSINKSQDVTGEGVWGYGFGNGIDNEGVWGETSYYWQTSPYTKSFVITEVINYNNNYWEYFTTDKLQYSLSSVTWDTSAGTLTFTTSNGECVVGPFYKNNFGVSRVRLSLLEGTDTDLLNYSVSTSTSSGWIDLSFGNEINLTTSATELYLKVDNEYTSGSYTSATIEKMMINYR